MPDEQSEAIALSDRIVVMNSGRIVQIGTPEEIYERPQTTFVANFVGTMNLVSAVVRSRDPDGLWRCFAGELEFVCSSLPSHVELGKRVLLGFRPEAAEVFPEPPTGRMNVWPGRVVQYTYLGNTVDLMLKVGEHTWRVALSPHQFLEHRDREACYVVVEPGRIKCLADDEEGSG